MSLPRPFTRFREPDASPPQPWRRRERAATAFAASLASVVLAAGLCVAALPGTASAAAELDNPYVGAKPYVNPDWSARAAAEPGGSAVADQPTFVWLDRIAAINGTSEARGLKAHWTRPRHRAPTWSSW